MIKNTKTLFSVFFLVNWLYLLFHICLLF